MTRYLALLLVVSAVAGLLAGCGSTPEPTEPPPTQTPWIVVVTATPGPGQAAQAQPTQTPWIIVATPTSDSQAEMQEPSATSATDPAVETPTRAPAQTGEPAQEATATTQPATPTNTPDASVLTFPPPALLDPPNNQPVAWKSTMLLRWSPVGELAEDQYYHLHVERRPQTEGQTWYGDYVYTKETEHLLEAAFLAPFHLSAEHDKAVVYWWVRVVRQTGVDDNGKPVGVDIGAPSEERTMILDTRTEGD
jgi:hypothetical protein